MKLDFTELFYFVDDYIQNITKNFVPSIEHRKKPGAKERLNRSEVLTILIGFYASSFDCFKNYYTKQILVEHSNDFKLVTYAHFTKLIGKNLPFLSGLLHHTFGDCTGISFVDSTSIEVCKVYRSNRHKVFQPFAKKSKTTKGWFYGLKLHLVINPSGELVDTTFSSGNTDDRQGLRTMAKNLFGKVVGDRGYLSKDLFRELFDKKIQLITRLKKGMKNILMPMEDKLLLLRRSLIETVIGKIKLLNKFEHSRHRSSTNGFCHMLACLINYQISPSKPSIVSLLSLGDKSM